MKGSFRQSMAWLHTWSGLIVGWVLFAVFVTGTASYYRPEISRWMQPELRQSEDLGPEALVTAAERAIIYLQQHAEQSRAWFITLPTAEKPVTGLFWRNAPGQPPNIVLLDPATGERAEVRETRGGDFLYRFHFELHMPPIWGRWIVGICAFIMLIALISGVITHKRIFTDFFTFRRDKAPRRSFLDAHNVTGVLALPYHLMITYTGIVTFGLMYMPWGVQTAYDGNQQRFYAETGQSTAARPPSGQPGTLATIGPMVRQALSTMPEPLERLSILNPYDANATVVAVFEEPHGISHEHPQIAFDGTTGEIREIRKGGLKPASKTLTTMVGLHEAHFAGPALRFLFFLSGLGGCAMVATGLLLWTIARLPKPGVKPSIGFHIVESLNIATIAGLPAAIAFYFLANRLLPAAWPERASWEIWAFFSGWLVLAIAALFRPHRRAWSELFVSTALLYVCVCAVDVARIVQGLQTGALSIDPFYIAFDTAMLALAALFAFAARKIAVYENVSKRKNSTSPNRNKCVKGLQRPNPANEAAAVPAKSLL